MTQEEHGGHGVTRRRCDLGDVAAAGRCAERWRLSAEEFNSARRSVFLESERSADNALWLGVEDAHERSRVDLHPCLVGSLQADFQPKDLDRAAFENVSVHHSSTQVCLEHPFWWCPGESRWRSFVRKAKLMSWDRVTRVNLVKAWG